MAAHCGGLVLTHMQFTWTSFGWWSIKACFFTSYSFIIDPDMWNWPVQPADMAVSWTQVHGSSVWCYSNFQTVSRQLVPNATSASLHYNNFPNTTKSSIFKPVIYFFQKSPFYS